MYFSLVQYISEEINSKSSIITSISEDFKSFFINRSYGDAVESLLIGVVCVNPTFAQFFRARNKYTKSKKMLEYSIILDFDSFRVTSDSDVRRILVKEILNSIDSIVDSLKINDFNKTQYKKDLEQLL